jgi:hypothetical protein
MIPRQAVLAVLTSLCLTVCADSASQEASRDLEPLPPIEMSQKPLNLPGLGIEVVLPVGSTSKQQTLSREVFADVIGKDNQWRLTISTQTSSNTEMGAKDAIEKILENLQKSFSVTNVDKPDEMVGTFARELAPIESIKFSGGEAFRFFLFQPSARDNVPDTIRGVAVIKTGPGQMLVWDMAAREENYAIAKQALDATLSAIVTTIAPLGELEREIALKTGQRLVKDISLDQMHSIFTNYGERWYRYYRVDEQGNESEIGYRRIKARLGTRGDLGGLGQGNSGESGYIVEIEARMLEENPVGNDRLIYDSKGSYFVSEDLNTETWNLIVVVKQGRQSTTFSELGAREGFLELLVTTSDPSGRGDTKKHSLKEIGYLPLAFSLILPAILSETNALGDIAFYTYRSDASLVAFRHDAIRHDPENEGHWIHRSSVSHDSPQIVKYVNADGNILREELPGGRRWVATAIEDLSRIWRGKGLPMN